MLQVSSPKSLRKLKARIDEIPEVSKYLYSIYNGESVTSITAELLAMKKVKENGNMVALLQEIEEYLKVPNLDAAKATVKRVFDTPTPVAVVRSQAKPREEPDLVLSVPAEDQGPPAVENLE